MIGPVPARVSGTVKAELLKIIDDAVAGGWSGGRACTVLGLDRQRAWRWHTRRQAGLALDDAPSGGNPIHGLLEWEETEILALFDEWSDTDRSHRKLAHRGSYEQRVWVSPSTVDRVCVASEFVSLLWVSFTPQVSLASDGGQRSALSSHTAG